MLRITIDQKVDSIALTLEGKLTGAWVQEMRTVWFRVQSMNKKPVVLRLTDISSVDASGRQLLCEMHSAGAVLTGSGLFARSLIEEVTGVPS